MNNHFKHPKLIFASILPFIILIVMIVTYEIQKGQVLGP